MKPVLLSRSTRLALAVSVSLWMMGGCLFGCSNTQVVAAEVTQSVHAQHSCCTRPKAATRLRNPTPKQALTGVSRGLKECPFMVNATAITTKSGVNSTDPVYTVVALLPNVERRSEKASLSLDHSYLPNRGPTHLRCCVFLI
ncbi:MAG TPA: hypothetical protein VGJ37_09820 [Pyrinomonadaceae bacterium]|jgi:hypothetical protein